MQPQCMTGRSVGLPSTSVLSQKFFFHAELDVEVPEIVGFEVIVDVTKFQSQEVRDR